MREKEEKGKEFKVEDDKVAFKNKPDCLNSEGSRNEPFVIDSHLYQACNCHE